MLATSTALQLARPPTARWQPKSCASRRDGAERGELRIAAGARRDDGDLGRPGIRCGTAALIADLEDARLRRNELPVWILTGAGWKDLQRLTADAERIPRIGPTDIGDRIDTRANSLAHTPRAG